MTERNATEIRAYCDRRNRLLDKTWKFIADGCQGRYKSALHLAFSEQAATDLPRVLDAAVKLRAGLLRCYNTGWLYKAVDLLAETAWLSPQPTVSSDGESGEGGET